MTKGFALSSAHFTQADTIIPNPGNSGDWDRYAYVLNNPFKYIDPSGNTPDVIVIVLLAIGIIFKAADYGWTAYDIFQSTKVLNDPNASKLDKLTATVNIAFAGIFELGEPDDILPVGLPLDDIGRKALMEGMEQALKEGGEEALEKYIRENLGDYADDVLKQLELGNLGDEFVDDIIENVYVLQSGGHTLTNRTINGLGLTRKQAKNGLEALKDALGLSHDFHGKILSDGSYLDPHTGELLGNIYDWID